MRASPLRGPAPCWGAAACAPLMFGLLGRRGQCRMGCQRREQRWTGGWASKQSPAAARTQHAPPPSQRPCPKPPPASIPCPSHPAEQPRAMSNPKVRLQAACGEPSKLITFAAGSIDADPASHHRPRHSAAGLLRCERGGQWEAHFAPPCLPACCPPRPAAPMPQPRLISYGRAAPCAAGVRGWVPPPPALGGSARRSGQLPAFAAWPGERPAIRRPAAPAC